MKTLPVLLSLLTTPERRRNLLLLARLLTVFVLMVAAYTVAFHYLMQREGREFSWVTGIYWTLTVMSTLGFGDITFESDAGRAFSVLVLLSGTTFMLALLPFVFIQFVYVPWMEAQSAARAPRELSAKTHGHVVITSLSAVEVTLVQMLRRANMDYVVLVPDLPQALRLHDEGYRVMFGDVDDRETYHRARADQAALVLTARSDAANTNVVFTVRESSPQVTIVATASSPASVDILELAGCNYVMQLAELLGQSLARRALGRDAKSHVTAEFGELLIAEAAAANTPLVGRTLRDIRLPDHANVSVVGLWDRGKFELAGPDSSVQATSVLMLTGSREQLDSYDELFCIYKSNEAPVVIIGGGRVGRATAKALAAQGIDYRIIEKVPERAQDAEKYIVGDAAELEVLHRAGILESSSVVITTHDDDVNVYLTIYCRRLRPDIQILARSNLDRNVSTLHRAGADFVLSYAAMGASMVFNMLRRADILLLAEGLDVFRVPVPRGLAGKSLAESAIRQDADCHVAAIAQNGHLTINPEADSPLPVDGELVLIGDAEAQQRFTRRFGTR